MSKLSEFNGNSLEASRLFKPAQECFKNPISYKEQPRHWVSRMEFASEHLKKDNNFWKNF